MKALITWFRNALNCVLDEHDYRLRLDARTESMQYRCIHCGNKYKRLK